MVSSLLTMSEGEIRIQDLALHGRCRRAPALASVLYEARHGDIG